jgi:bacillithiol system protein YtxJ
MFNWRRKTPESSAPIPRLIDLDIPFGMESAILFKHSTRCPVSVAAFREVQQFRSENPEMPVFLVLVREDRPLALQISERTGIEHASPQILVLQKGSVLAAVSHEQITADEIGEIVASQLRSPAKA